MGPRRARAAAALAATFALVAMIAGATAQQPDQVGVQLQFDNRGIKVARPGTISKIQQAVAECLCNVPLQRVQYTGTIGQSTLLNHQSVSSFTCTGPTTSGVPVLTACQRNSKGGLLTSSPAAKCVRRNTNGWLPGDAVTLQQATCQSTRAQAPGGGQPRPSG